MPTRTPHPSRRAVTLIELLVVLVVIGVVIGVLLPAVSTRRCGIPRQMRDSMNVRNTTQALIVWASNNKDSYPLPSEIDTANATIDALASTKDTTGNILSVLIMTGNILPEQLISPAEVNPRIQRCDNYQYGSPSAAAIPQNALWDPSFRGTPDDLSANDHLDGSGIGHQSFAHAIPFGRRHALWSATYNSTEAIFANRGPTYAASDAAPASDKWSLPNDPHGAASNTLLIRGGRNTWEGNVGYNDNHVNFETKPSPDHLAITLASPPRSRPSKSVTAPDNLFVNESNERDGDGTTGRVDRGMNAYLRPIADVLERTRPRVWRD